MEKKYKILETLVVLALASIIIPVVFKLELSKQYLWLPIALLIIGLFIPFLAKFIHSFWMRLSEMMGYVMSKVVLGIVFFLFLTPIALIFRLIGKNTFVLNKNKNTYFNIRNYQYKSEDLKNIW